MLSLLQYYLLELLLVLPLFTNAVANALPFTILLSWTAYSITITY